MLENLLTTNDLCNLFRRSLMTILIWRKNKGLPYIRIPGSKRDTIRFDQEAVLEWAQRTGRRIYPYESNPKSRRDSAKPIAE